MLRFPTITQYLVDKIDHARLGSAWRGVGGNDACSDGGKLHCLFCTQRSEFSIAESRFLRAFAGSQDHRQGQDDTGAASGISGRLEKGPARVLSWCHGSLPPEGISDTITKEALIENLIRASLMLLSKDRV